MKYPYLVGVWALMITPASAQFGNPQTSNTTPPALNYVPPAPSSTIPAIQRIPPTVSATPPTAIIGPTSSIPKPQGPQFSSVVTITEQAAGVAENAPNSRSLGFVGRVGGRALGPLSLYQTIDGIASPLYRSHECARNGDIAGADRANAEAQYNAIGAIPVVGLAQACADIIGTLTVGKDVVKDAVVSVLAASAQHERDMNAQGIFMPNHLYAGDNPTHYWIPQARRNTAFDQIRQANEQASANRRASSAQPASGTDLGYMNEMMFMLLPAAIVAQQQRAIAPPLSAAAPNLTALPTASPLSAGRSMPTAPALGSGFGSTPPVEQGITPPKSDGKYFCPFGRFGLTREEAAKCR